MDQILDAGETSQPIDIKKYRRSLLPWWIKGFSWLFMIFGVFIIPSIIAAIINFPIELAFYGIEAYTVFSLNGAIITLFFLVSSLVGYGLFFSKDWAILLGLVLCIMHAVLLASVIMFPLTSDGNTIRLEFILVIPFFIKLLKLKQIWDGPNNNNAKTI